MSRQWIRLIACAAIVGGIWPFTAKAAHAQVTDVEEFMNRSMGLGSLYSPTSHAGTDLAWNGCSGGGGVWGHNGSCGHPSSGREREPRTPDVEPASPSHELEHAPEHIPSAEELREAAHAQSVAQLRGEINDAYDLLLQKQWEDAYRRFRELS